MQKGYTIFLCYDFSTSFHSNALPALSVCVTFQPLVHQFISFAQRRPRKSFVCWPVHPFSYCSGRAVSYVFAQSNCYSFIGHSSGRIILRTGLFACSFQQSAVIIFMMFLFFYSFQSTEQIFYTGKTLEYQQKNNTQTILVDQWFSLCV